MFKTTSFNKIQTPSQVIQVRPKNSGADRYDSVSKSKKICGLKRKTAKILFGIILSLVGLFVLIGLIFLIIYLATLGIFS